MPFKSFNCLWCLILDRKSIDIKPLIYCVNIEEKVSENWLYLRI